MKTNWSTIAASLGAAILCSWSTVAPAQSVTVKETTSSGTITEYAPGGQAIIVRQEQSAPPISYAVTERTTFIDETGAPVVAERVTSGTPITVHYAREGDRMIATRVVVRKTVSNPTAVVTQRPTVTTTTTGAGTITQFSPGSQMVIRSEAAEPLNYAVSSNTTYVDETGAPIAVERISPGVPVTVHYIREGDRMVASRVVVTRSAPAVPATTTTRQTTTTSTTKDDEDDDDD